MSEIKYYFKAVQLSNEIKQRNKIKLGTKSQRFDIVAYWGNYEPMEQLKNKHGRISFILNESRHISRKYNRVANFYLQGKNSFNFSGLYMLDDCMHGIGFGNPYSKETYGALKIKNPFYDNRNDSFVFRVSNDLQQIECFVFDNGLNVCLAIAQDLQNGKFDDEIKEILSHTKSILSLYS